MNEDVKDGSAKVSARRRLIRGAFAAPAALTLYSGSSFAQASVTCVAKQVSNPPSPLPGVSEGMDIWVRVPLYGLGSSGNISRWVKGADVLSLKALNSTAYLSTGQWQCVSSGTGDNSWTVNKSPPYTDLEVRLPNGSTPVMSNRYIALRIDADGNILGVVGIDSGGSTVAGTCWTSFRVASV